MGISDFPVKEEDSGGQENFTCADVWLELPETKIESAKNLFVCSLQSGQGVFHPALGQCS